MADYKVLAISGAIYENSTCKNLIKHISAIDNRCTVSLFEIIELPHFIPGTDEDQIPEEVNDLKLKIEESDAVLIITPEYIYSLPAILKNALEWMVSSTVFDAKPVAYIVAAPSGEKAFESIDLILSTMQAGLSEDCKLLLKGLKGKVNVDGSISDDQLTSELKKFYSALVAAIET